MACSERRGRRRPCRQRLPISQSRTKFVTCRVRVLPVLLWRLRVQHSDKALVFILFFLFGTSTMSFTMFVRDGVSQSRVLLGRVFRGFL